MSGFLKFGFFWVCVVGYFHCIDVETVGTHARGVRCS